MNIEHHLHLRYSKERPAICASYKLSVQRLFNDERRYYQKITMYKLIESL